MKPIKSISVFGLGKLGACMAATFAARGFDVTGIDINPKAVRYLNAGVPPVDEPNLGETIMRAGKRLRATIDPAAAVATDASFFIVPTPSNSDGSFSNKYLVEAMTPCAKEVRKAGNKGHLFVVSSTTTPGSCRAELIPLLERLLHGKCGRDFGFCFNPEFIALGDVIKGLYQPDMILIGESDKDSGDRLQALYRKFHATNEKPPHVARMSITSAELTKISVNSYVTMKISFTNQLRMIADKYPETDIHQILSAIGSDSRIGRRYLRAGLSYGGVCFPRDNRLVQYAANHVGVDAPLSVATDEVNDTVLFELADKIVDYTTTGDTIAILGLTYKPGTYITEESAGMYLIEKLNSHLNILAHDFMANKHNTPALRDVEMLDLKSLHKNNRIKAVAICCDWPGYANVKLPKNARVFDPWGVRRLE